MGVLDEIHEFPGLFAHGLLRSLRLRRGGEHAEGQGRDQSQDGKDDEVGRMRKGLEQERAQHVTQQLGTLEDGEERAEEQAAVLLSADLLHEGCLGDLRKVIRINFMFYVLTFYKRLWLNLRRVYINL